MKMTDTLRGFLEAARKIAKRRGNSKVTPYHFLEACASNKFGSSVADMIIQIFDIENELVEQCYERTPHGRQSLSNNSDGPALKRAISRAEQISRSFKDSVIGAEHMLLAVLEDKGVQSLPLIKAKGLEMKEQIYHTLDIPNDDQKKVIAEIERLISISSEPLFEVHMNGTCVYLPARFCACLLAVRDKLSHGDVEQFLWYWNHTTHLAKEKKKKGKKVARQEPKKDVPVVSGYISAGEANRLSLLSRLKPGHRKRVDDRLKRKGI